MNFFLQLLTVPSYGKNSYICRKILFLCIKLSIQCSYYKIDRKILEKNVIFIFVRPKYIDEVIQSYSIKAIG